MPTVKFAIHHKLIYAPSKEFDNILKLLEKSGFTCREESREEKILCVKDGSKIEFLKLY